MDISQFEAFAEEAKKSAAGANRLISDVTFSWFVEEAGYSETTFDEVNERVRALFAIALKSGDWKNVEMLATGKVEYVNASHVVMKYEQANATPMSEISHLKTSESVPLWISAYANVFLAHGKCLRPYLSSKGNALLSNPEFETMVERRARLLHTGAK